MGIPSFYRHLCKRFPKLISIAPKGAQGPEWLCLDFNCAMYYVLRRQPAFVAGETNKAGWESNLCKDIAAYMEEIVTVAGPTKGVYVSCDGAVCAAKRRQQRLRRFKGPWASALERQITGTKKEEGWDQNALTPGTAFMAQLGEVLIAAGARLQVKLGIPVTVSTTAEPGEGEHKLLAHMRAIGVSLTSCMIYGLDADLILLAMLLGADTGADVRLLREAQEFEGMPKGIPTNGGWRTLHITGLVAALLPSPAEPSKVRDFVAAMSLLGNDFLPRSLTHTVRDDGIPTLIASLQKHVWDPGFHIVSESGSLSRIGLLALLKPWAADEERNLLAAAANAMKVSRYPSGIGATPEATALKEWNAQPARWATASKLLDPMNRSKLRPAWASMYRSWHPGFAGNYIRGLAWNWDYYAGRPVDQSWYFDQHLPPLWSDIVAYLDAMKASVLEPPPIEYSSPLPDWLHLFAVLPAASIERLLPPKVQALMAKAPWYWPASWSVYDVGRTQMWECEPIIPQIPERVLRQLMTEIKK
jgi:5'-3' exonuclease